MNKDEILKKARNHKKNSLGEYENNIYKLGTMYSFICMFIVCVLLMFMKMEVNQSYYDVYCISSIGIAIPNLFIGYKLKNKNNIFQGVIWSLGAILSFWFYYQSLFG